MGNRILVLVAALTAVLSIGCKDNKTEREANKTHTPTPNTQSTKTQNAADAASKVPKAPPAKKQLVLKPGKDMYGDGLPHGTSVRMGTARLRHVGSVSAVAVSPDGSVIVSCGFGSDAVWELASGKRLRSFDGCGNDLYFNADGTQLITTAKGSVTVIDYVTSEVKRSVKVHDKHIRHLAVSKDRTKALTMSADKTSKLIELDTGKELRVFTGKGWTRRMALSPDARWAALHFDTFQVFDTATGTPLRLPLGKRQRADAFTFSPDSKRLAISTAQKLQVWELSTGKRVTEVATKSSMSALAYSSDGTLLAAAAGHTLSLIDTVTGAVKQVIARPSAIGGKLVFTPDGKRLITIAGRDNTIRVIDVQTGNELLRRPAHSRNVGGIAFSADGSRVISHAGDNTIRVWNSSNGVHQARWQPFGNSVSTTMATNSNGHYVAVAGRERLVHVWDTKVGKPHKSLTIDTKESWPFAIALAVTPSAHVVAALTTGYAVVWDVVTGTQRAAWKTPARTVQLALAPNGQWLATVSSSAKDSANTVVRVWNTATGAPVHTLSAHTARVSEIMFLPDGRLVSLGDDNNVRFWNVKLGKEVYKMSRRSPRHMVVSGDGKRFAVADGWGRVEIWDLSGPALIHKLKLHIWFKSMALSTDGKTLASSDSSNDILLWAIGK